MHRYGKSLADFKVRSEGVLAAAHILMLSTGT